MIICIYYQLLPAVLGGGQNYFHAVEKSLEELAGCLRPPVGPWHLPELQLMVAELPHVYTIQLVHIFLCLPLPFMKLELLAIREQMLEDLEL
jgi:hypothetical protein